MTDLVATEIDAHVQTVRLNRPDKKNAITHAMYLRLAEALAAADADPSVRATLLTGNGSCFTVGNDLGDFLSDALSSPDAPVLRFLRALSGAKKPLVAAVHGHAVGVGTTLLFHCDLVYAARDTRFSLPFVNLGLVPEAGASLLLPSLAGYQRAAEHLLLGEPFSAEVAREMGLVNRVCESDKVWSVALATARALAAKPMAAVMETKALMRRPPEPIDARMDAEVAVFKRRLASPEAQQAFAAFLKRRPSVGSTPSLD